MAKTAAFSGEDNVGHALTTLARSGHLKSCVPICVLPNVSACGCNALISGGDRPKAQVNCHTKRIEGPRQHV